MAGPCLLHQWEAPHPPSWAPQPEGFSLAGGDDGVAGGFEVLVVLPRVAGRLVLLWLWASIGSRGAAASADGTARAAAEIAALARPWRRRSTSGRERRGMRISETETQECQFWHGAAQAAPGAHGLLLTSSAGFPARSAPGCWWRCIRSRSLRRCAHSDSREGA